MSLPVGKNDMMIQMVDKPNTTPIGQDRETLTFKSFALFKCCVVYIPLFNLVTPL